MQLPGGASAPRVTVVDISDAMAVGAGIEVFDLDAMQLQSTPFRGRRVTVRLGAATVVSYSTNLRVRTRTRARPGIVGYVAFGPHCRGSVNGLSVREGLLLAAAPESEARFVVDADWEDVAFMVRPEDVAAHLAARRREGEYRMPRDVDLLDADPAAVRALFDWGKRLVDTAVREPALFDLPRNAIVAEMELFEALLHAIGSAARFALSRSETTRQSYSLVVKNAEDYALSHVGEPLHVGDLCRAASVSERTLEHAFKEIMGLTPVNYLIRLRLHRVRQELVAAHHATTTVSAVAINWGFWHFGEFSRAYRECFQELPSTTLRRQSEFR